MLNKISYLRFGLISGISLISSSLFAQVSVSKLSGTTGNNPISTAVPFLTIAPDGRASGMGDAGVASSPDANSMHWNTSKLAFAKEDGAVSMSYTPWLKALNVNDIYLAYVSGYFKVDKRQAIGGSVRYFSLGDINFTDATGNSIGTYRPNEFAIDAGYALKLSSNLSGGITLKYIRSDLSQGISNTGNASTAGQSVAADISAYYIQSAKIADKKIDYSAGANFSNIGSKISYSVAGREDFIPMNMRIGGGAKIAMDDYNTITVLLDINKLLVPTPPVLDSAGNIKSGVDPSNKSIAGAIFGSFNDAPGGFSEELRELMYSTGLEYWYDNQFAVRAGYFYEDLTKGGRQYMTLGLGLRYNVFGLDFSYLVPTTAQRSPLENTLRFSLLFNFDSSSKTTSN